MHTHIHTCVYAYIYIHRWHIHTYIYVICVCIYIYIYVYIYIYTNACTSKSWFGIERGQQRHTRSPFSDCQHQQTSIPAHARLIEVLLVDDSLKTLRALSECTRARTRMFAYANAAKMM